MFDWLRDFKKTDEEKRQEAITAYLDDLLTSDQRQHFEKQLAEDSNLRREVEGQLFIKENLGRLPRVAAPRNFTLDPANYGVPQRQAAPIFYPALRVATALAAIVFVLAVVLDLFIIDGTSGPLQTSSTEEAEVAFDTGLAAEEAVEEAQAEELESAPREPEQLGAEAADAAEDMAVAAEAPVAEEVAEDALAATPLAMAEVEAEGESGDAALNGALEEPAEEEEGIAAAQELGSDEIESEVPQPLPTMTDAQPSPRTAPTDAVRQPDSESESEPSGSPASTPAVSRQEPNLPREPIPPVDEASGVQSAEIDEAAIDTSTDAVKPIRLVEITLGVGVILLAAVTWLVRRRL